MKKNTTNQPKIQHSDLCDDTIVYRAAKPRVRVFEIDVLETIGSILNFRASSLRVAREIIRRQGGENITIVLSDAAFAEALWPDLPGDVRVRKLKRCKQNLKEDQSASCFQFIYKLPRQAGQTEEGRYYGYPSKYKPGHYWEASDELQDRSDRIDYFQLNVHERRKAERATLAAILTERECKKIVRLRKKKEAKEVKEKAPSLPCNCACAHCVHCLTKNSATGGEANGAKPAPVGSRELITREVVNREIETALEMLFQAGARWANLGLDTKEYWKKILDGYGINELRLADAIKRSNAPSVRLVGGQPK